MNFWCGFFIFMGVFMSALANNGLITIASKHSVKETLDRLEDVLKEKGVRVFARIDFSGDAEKEGLQMKPSQLLIFGNPKAGTPLMVAAPTVAIDLPLKALSWEDPKGKVWLSYNSPEYLQERHKVPEELLKNIAGIKTFVEKAVE